MNTLECQNNIIVNRMENMDVVDNIYGVESKNILECQDYIMDVRVENLDTLECQDDNNMCDSARMYGQTEDACIDISVVKCGTSTDSVMTGVEKKNTLVFEETKVCVRNEKKHVNDISNILSLRY